MAEYVFVLLWLCTSELVATTPTRETPANVTAHMTLTFNHYQAEFLPNTSDTQQTQYPGKLPPGANLELLMQCGDRKCNLKTSYCDIITNNCASCANLCKDSRITDTYVREKCYKNCPVYLYYQSQEQPTGKAAKSAQVNITKDDRKSTEILAMSTVALGYILLLIITVCSLVFQCQAKKLMQLQQSILTPKTDLEESYLAPQDFCKKDSQTEKTLLKKPVDVPDSGISSKTENMHSENSLAYAKSTALMGEVDLMIMGVASLVFLLQMKSLMQRQLSQLAPKTNLEESSLPLAEDKNDPQMEETLLKNSMDAPDIGISSTTAHRIMENSLALYGHPKQEKDQCIKTGHQTLSLLTSSQPSVPPKHVNPASDMQTFSGENLVSDVTMVKATDKPSPVICSESQKSPAEGCVKQESKTDVQQGKEGDNSDSCTAGASILNPEEDDVLWKVQIPFQNCLLDRMGKEERSAPTEESVNIKAEYKKFKKEINRIRAPAYVQGSSCDEVCNKIYIDIDRGTTGKAFVFFQAHFRIQMAQGLISLTEQEPMEYAVNGMDGEAEGQNAEESSQYLVLKEVAPIYMPKQEIAEGSRLIPVHAEVGNQSPALQKECSSPLSFQQVVGNLCVQHTSIHDACISVVDGSSGHGTLAGFAVDRSGIVYGITAFHVLCAKKENKITSGEIISGTKAVVTEISRNGQDRIVPIGYKVWGCLGAYKETDEEEEEEKAMDFAIFEIPQSLLNNTRDRGLFQFGFKDTSGNDVTLEVFSGKDEDMLGIEVIKNGMVTGNISRSGKIVLVNSDIAIDRQICGGAFAVDGLGKVSNFASRGDSGALVREKDGNRVFGILFKIRKTKGYGELVWCVRLDRCFEYARRRWDLSLSLYQTPLLSNACSLVYNRVPAEGIREVEVEPHMSGACAVPLLPQNLPPTTNVELNGKKQSTFPVRPLTMQIEKGKLEIASGNMRKSPSDPLMVSQWQRNEAFNLPTSSLRALSDPIKPTSTNCSLESDQKKDSEEPQKYSPSAFSAESISKACQYENADSTQSSLFQSSRNPTNTHSSLFASSDSLASPVPASDKEFEYPSTESEPLFTSEDAFLRKSRTTGAQNAEKFTRYIPSVDNEVVLQPLMSADAFLRKSKNVTKAPGAEKCPCDSGVGLSTSL